MSVRIARVHRGRHHAHEPHQRISGYVDHTAPAAPSIGARRPFLLRFVGSRENYPTLALARRML